MEDPDVDAVLRLVGLRHGDDSSSHEYSRKQCIQRLMNITLQCLGALRVLTVEEEKIRIASDSCDIDGSCKNDGKAERLQRDIFSGAVKTVVETVVSAQELDTFDPMKDLIESFPWSQSLNEPGWLMLDWTIAADGVSIENENDRAFHMQAVRNVMSCFPDTTTELDKLGQQYMAYAIRKNYGFMVEELVAEDRESVKLKDGTGKMVIHYCAAHTQSNDMLHTIMDAMGKAPDVIMTKYDDDDGNLPIHFAAAGTSNVNVLKEIIFCNPDAIRMPNSTGMLPLHLAACNRDLDKAKALFAAYPQAVGIPDKNGWLPLQHAAFTGKHLDVVRFIHECYPEAINKPHQSGRIPLHYCAVTCQSSKVMAYLIDAYPDGAQTFDMNRRLPLHNVVARCTHMTPARLRCMRLLLEIYPPAAGMAGSDGVSSKVLISSTSRKC